MVALEADPQRAPRRRWPLSEKRRLVELTLRKGASVSAIVLAHDVRATTLFKWRKLYAVGKLDADVLPVKHERRGQSKIMLLPVTVAPTDSLGKHAFAASIPSRFVGMVELTFSCGTSMRIESDVLDTTIICALVAQVQR